MLYLIALIPLFIAMVMMGVMYKKGQDAKKERGFQGRLDRISANKTLEEVYGVEKKKELYKNKTIAKILKIFEIKPSEIEVVCSELGVHHYIDPDVIMIGQLLGILVFGLSIVVILFSPAVAMVFLITGMMMYLGFKKYLFAIHRNVMFVRKGLLPQFIKKVGQLLDVGLTMHDAVDYIVKQEKNELTELFERAQRISDATSRPWDECLNDLKGSIRDFQSFDDLLTLILLGYEKGTKGLAKEFYREGQTLNKVYKLTFDKEIASLQSTVMLTIFVTIFVPFILMLLIPIMSNVITSLNVL